MVASSASYPGKHWLRVSASEVDFKLTKLNLVKKWLDKRGKNCRYRVVIIRGGRLVANWNRGFNTKKIRLFEFAFKALKLLFVIFKMQVMPMTFNYRWLQLPNQFSLVC